MYFKRRLPNIHPKQDAANSLSNNLIENEKDAINTNLEDTLKRHSGLERRRENFRYSMYILDSIWSHTSDLMSQVDHVANLARSVSAKVRRLDLARVRASGCQQRVHDLIDFQLCSEGVVKAMNDEDFEKVSVHISRFLAMNQQELQRTAYDVQEYFASVNETMNILENATKEMRRLALQKFDEAARKDDQASIERFFKMFPQLGMHTEGIEKFAKYVCWKLSLKLNKELTSVITSAKEMNRSGVAYADALTYLLENFAQVLEVNRPFVELYYGSSYIINFVKLLQLECDVEITSLLKMFVEHRRVLHYTQLLNKYGRCVIGNEKSLLQFPKSSKNTSVSMDMYSKDINTIIDEITLMHSSSERYFRFIQRKVLQNIEGKLSDKQEIDKYTEQLHKILHMSDLSLQMQELLSTYLTYERYFMEESIQKAIDLDTCENGQLYSSMVDDVFFILRKSLRRSSSTFSINGLCAVINIAASCLDVNFVTALKNSLDVGYPSEHFNLSHSYNTIQNTLQQSKLQTSDKKKARQKFLTQLNNADICTQYIESLWQMIEEDIGNTFVKISAVERQIADGCISELKAIHHALRTCVNYGMQQLRSSAIKHRVNLWIEQFYNYKHSLSEEEHADYLAGETFVQYLIGQISGLLDSFKSSLTPNNYDALIVILATDTATQLEEALYKTSFNRIGGLIFDQEVRSLCSIFTGYTSFPVRDKITRLTQIATVLNLDKVEELEDYWNSGNETLSWHLTAHEVKNILMLRTDFRLEDINRLEL